MTVQQIVDLLNEAVAADPVAMRRLIRGSARANDALVDHPRIVCWSGNEASGGAPVANWLGLLIGIASLDGLSIDAKWSDDLEDLLGFEVVNNSIEEEMLRLARLGSPGAN